MLLEHPVTISFPPREAVCAAIKSEHVIRIFHVGALDTGEAYSVMEFVQGRALDAWVAQNGARPIEQAVDFVIHACDALAEGHALGVVHSRHQAGEPIRRRKSRHRTVAQGPWLGHA
jgi:serine/threonine-protein kinase